MSAKQRARQGARPDTTQKKEETKETSSDDLLSYAFKYLVSFLMGIVFGFALQKCRVSDPQTFHGQMMLDKYVLVKMYLSAVATGVFAMTLMTMLPWTGDKFQAAAKGYYDHLAGKGVVSSSVGGLLMGIGIAISYSSPTIIFSQIGAMVPNIGYTFAGALLGTTIYGVMKPVMDSMTKANSKEADNPWTRSSYIIKAISIVMLFGGVVYFLENSFPWQSEVKMVIKPATEYSFAAEAWPPYISGCLIGCMEIPAILCLGLYLGGSSSFVCMVAQVFVGPLESASSFIAKFRRSFGGWWQIFYVCGAILGGYLSASLSGTLGTAVGVPPSYSFIGGVIMIIGARIAGGCISGHGISGGSFMCHLSFITMAALLCGGVVTARLLQTMGLSPL